MFLFENDNINPPYQSCTNNLPLLESRSCEVDDTQHYSPKQNRFLYFQEFFVEIFLQKIF